MDQRARWARRAGLVAGGLSCGILVALSVPPFGFWPLAWLGFAGLALLARGARPGARALAGAGAGLGQYGIGLWWVQEFSGYGCAVLIVLSTLYVAGALLAIPGRRWGIFVLPAAFVLDDWARDHFPLQGFPLGGISLGQATSPLAPVVRLGGSLLLTGVTVLVGVVLAHAVLAIRWGAGGWRPGAALAALALGLVVAGHLAPGGAALPGRPLRVALVQGGGPRGTRAVNTNPQIPFDRQVAASATLSAPLDLVVWPEGMLQSVRPFATGGAARQVADLAESTGATVVAGVEQDVGARRYLNLVVAWAPDGRVVATYVKNHRVPFGEYIPDRALVERFFNVADVPYDEIPGHGPGILRTPAGPLGVMISYEVFFDGRARAAVRAGGQVLVVPTNTSSYRSTEVPAEEVAAAELSARETGRWLLQVTPTGYTAVIDPAGRLVASSVLDARAVVIADVPRLSGQTLYVRFARTPVLVVAGSALSSGWLLAWRRRPRRGRP